MFSGFSLAAVYQWAAGSWSALVCGLPGGCQWPEGSGLLGACRSVEAYQSLEPFWLPEGYQWAEGSGLLGGVSVGRGVSVA